LPVHALVALRRHSEQVSKNKEDRKRKETSEDTHDISSETVIMKSIVREKRGLLFRKNSAIVLVLILASNLLLTQEVFGATTGTMNISRVSVHDPSIYYDSVTGKYYIFGSHVAQASSTDLISWSPLGTQGYGNKALYSAPTYEGYYYLKNKNSGLYLTVAGGAATDGAGLQQAKYTGSEIQKFKIVLKGSDFYYVQTGASGYDSCLEVTDASSADNTLLEQTAYTGKTQQLYQIKQNEDGTITLLTKTSKGKSAVGVTGSSKKSGSSIGQAVSKELDSQKWELVKAGATGNPSRNTETTLTNALAVSFAWAGYNDADQKGGMAIWAPDIIYNPSYAWADGTTGAYMLYYCTSSTYNRSCIGYSVSKAVTGPFQYVDTIVYSGFTSKDVNVTTTSRLGTKTVNINYKNTNIPELIDNGTLTGMNKNRFKSDTSYNSTSYPNALDPNVVYDRDGKLWLTYGSWSGGIFTLPLNSETGQPIRTNTDTDNTDAYFGTKIAGGYGHFGEGPYIVYDKATDYYYLYESYCWLATLGGYQIRMFRSSNLDGPYTDAVGNSAVYTATSNIADLGIKLFGNYNLSSLPVGYQSGGHCSAFIDTDGQRYLVYHTRFNRRSEAHEVRVHQQFLNEDNWPVTAVYEYLGSKISEKGYSKNEMCGTYQFINMGKDASTKNVGMLTTQSVKLNADGKITGDVKGKWSYKSGTYYCTMVIGGVTYKGVFYKQKNEGTEHKAVMTFSLIGDNNQCIWGSK
jgi:arabinan endo-1,5-alpha-L-arabinosidase